MTLPPPPSPSRVEQSLEQVLVHDVKLHRTYVFYTEISRPANTLISPPYLELKVIPALCITITTMLQNSRRTVAQQQHTLTKPGPRPTEPHNGALLRPPEPYVRCTEATH